MGVNDFIKVGSRIKEARLNHNPKISQKEMARLLDIPVPTYSGYENNHREPNKETIEKIADILGVVPIDLMGFHQVLDIPEIGSALYDFSNEETQKFIEMVSDYKQLNSEGRNKVGALANDLTHVKKYRKDYEPELEQLQVKLPDSDTKE